MVTRLVTLGKEAGFKGLFAGLGPRMVMTAGLVAGQFLLYSEIKHGEFMIWCILYERARTEGVNMKALGAPPGLEIHKEEQ